MKKNSLVLVLILVGLLSNPVQGCVGRLLIVAITDSPDQAIMAEMLAELINQRTGTTVEIVHPGDLKACHKAVLDEKANIYIDYIENGAARMGGSYKDDNPQKAYTLVSQFHLEKFAMVWLRPFGYLGPLTLEANSEKGGGTLAVPVTTKDVLRRFPVLDRLINKLGNRIDNHTMEVLKKRGETQDVKDVVKAFLKAQKLI